MGGGGSRQTSETSQQVPSELKPAYREFGNLASTLLGDMGGYMPGFMQDQTVQQVAGPTGIENAAYGVQQGMLEGGGPQAWADAQGMFASLGNLPAWGGANLSGIQGWGQSPIPGAPASRAAPPRVGGQPQAVAGKSMRQQDGTGGGGGGGGGGAGGGAPGGGGYDPTGGGQPITPVAPGTPGAAAFDAATPPGGTLPAYTQASQGQGISAPGMGQAGGTGTVREIDMGALASKYPGGGGSGSFSYSSGGGGNVGKEDRIGDVLSEIDFANHPALASALDTFTKTSLPGIENNMIGAGLGRSGAAGNAIATGRAQMALPVMQQLIQGELTQRGQDVTQRGQDTQANIAAAQAAAQARAQGASLQQQRYMADLAAQQTMRGQDINMRGQDINALLQQGAQGLQARGQDINALLGGAQGLMGAGQADVDFLNNAIGGSMNMGGAFRDMANQQAESEFMAGQRPADRAMDIFSAIGGGAMGSGGTRTTTTGGGK